MKTAHLERFAYLRQATVGKLSVGRSFSCYTLERPWDDNRPNVSCIPDGSYECKPFSGKKFKEVIEITDVPGRSYILFHAANYPEELEGCVAPGMHFALTEEHARVWESKIALEEIKRVTASHFMLHVYSAAAQLNPNPAPLRR